MRVALAIDAEDMKMAKNGGHAARFAIYELIGDRAELLEVRRNPREDVPQTCNHDHDHDHDHGEEEEHDHHHHADETPEDRILRQQKKQEMVDSLSDCETVYTHFACPGTRKAFSGGGIKVEAFRMAGMETDEVLKMLQGDRVWKPV